MSSIWHILKRDCHAVRTNVIAMVVAVGLVVVPSLYAWFNIAAEWNPYGNTSGVRVAVANADEGYKGDALPTAINVGEQVENALRANDQLDWVFTSEQEACDGVASGRYYAALVIPTDFSAKMMTVLSDDVQHATITYYSNQKESAIAPKVTDQGADTVRSTVNQVFTQTVTEVGAGLVSDLSSFLNGDQVAGFASRVDSTVVQASSDLRATASNVSAFSSLVSSASSLMDSTTQLLGGTDDASRSLAEALDGSRSGVEQAAGAITGSTDAINSALESSTGSFDDVTAAVDKAFDSGTTSVSDAAGILRGQASKVSDSAMYFRNLSSDLSKIRDQLNNLPPATSEIATATEATQSGGAGQSGSSATATTESVSVTRGAGDWLAPIISRADGTATTLETLAETLNSQADAIEQSATTANADRQALKDLIAQSRQQVSGVRSEDEETLRDQAAELASCVGEVSSSASGVADTLSETVSDLRGVSTSASHDLAKARDGLEQLAARLNAMADDLDAVHAQVSEALASGDLERVRQVIGSDPAGLASSLAAPVGLDRQAIYPVENTGSSMAPYFTTLAIWVGCVILSAMLKVVVPSRVLAGLGNPKPRHVYVGRFLFFLLLSLLQSSLICLGDLFYLQIQCEDPLLFMLTGWVDSFVFLNIVYALTVSFGDVGKAVGVVLMVVQVAGSGGIFPVEVMPDFFKAVYEFLPFVHSMAMFKYAIAGGLPGEYWAAMGKLVSFVVPALALGLALRKPVVRLNAWFMRQLESTKVM